MISIPNIYKRVQLTQGLTPYYNIEPYILVPLENHYLLLDDDKNIQEILQKHSIQLANNLIPIFIDKDNILRRLDEYILQCECDYSVECIIPKNCEPFDLRKKNLMKTKRNEIYDYWDLLVSKITNDEELVSQFYNKEKDIILNDKNAIVNINNEFKNFNYKQFSKKKAPIIAQYWRNMNYVKNIDETEDYEIKDFLTNLTEYIYNVRMYGNENPEYIDVEWNMFDTKNNIIMISNKTIAEMLLA